MASYFASAAVSLAALGLFKTPAQLLTTLSPRPQQRLGLAAPAQSTSNSMLPPPPPPPTINEPARDGEDDDDDGADDDGVPSFPLPNSIQRAGASSKAPQPAPLFSLSAPDYDSDEDESEAPALPPRFQEAGALAAPTSTVTKGKRVKVAIEKGYSQLDWARMKGSGADLRVSLHTEEKQAAPAGGGLRIAG